MSVTLINGRPAESKPSAAVAILHASLPEAAVLLMRRALRPGDPWSGHWSFPGGRYEVSDPDLLHTALRELHEECGIVLTREHLTERLEDDWAGRVVGSHVMVAPFVFNIPEQVATTLDHSEAAEAVWVPMATLQDLSLHRVREIPGIPPEPVHRAPPFPARRLASATVMICGAAVFSRGAAAVAKSSERRSMRKRRTTAPLGSWRSRLLVSSQSLRARSQENVIVMLPGTAAGGGVFGERCFFMGCLGDGDFFITGF